MNWREAKQSSVDDSQTEINEFFLQYEFNAETLAFQ